MNKNARADVWLWLTVPIVVLLAIATVRRMATILKLKGGTIPNFQAVTNDEHSVTLAITRSILKIEIETMSWFCLRSITSIGRNV